MLHSSEVRSKWDNIPIAIQAQAQYCPVTHAAINTYVHDGFTSVEQMLVELVKALYAKAKNLEDQLVEIKSREVCTVKMDTVRQFPVEPMKIANDPQPPYESR